MKKAISIFLVGILIGLTVNAQQTKESNGKKEGSSVSFGLKAGVNIANIKESGDGISVTYSSLTSFTGGAYLVFHFKPTFGLQTELLYNGAGAKVSGSGNIGLGYLSVPVLAKYTIANSGLGIFAGPQFGFLLSAKSKPISGPSEDVKSSFKGTDISGIIGADYTFKGGFNIGVRYQFGLSDINDSGGFGTDKNLAFNITIGYTIK